MQGEESSPLTVGTICHFLAAQNPPLPWISPQISPLYLGDSGTHLSGQNQRDQDPLPPPQMQVSHQMPAPGTLILEQGSQGQQEGLFCLPATLTLWWPRYHADKTSSYPWGFLPLISLFAHP